MSRGRDAGVPRFLRSASLAAGEFFEGGLGGGVVGEAALVAVEGGGVGVPARGAGGPADAVGLVQQLVVHDEVDDELGDVRVVEGAAEHDRVADPVVMAELAEGG